MNTRHLVAPELLAGLDILPSLDLRPDTLMAIRQGMKEFTPAEEAYTRRDVTIERRTIASGDTQRGIDIVLYRPVALQALGPSPALLFIHGGGYVFGSADGSGTANVRTAAELGCTILSVEYRLAPETSAPGAVEDCYAALRWLHENAAENVIDRSRIAIAGESAGGGLAAALALLTRDRGEFEICFQLLIYPMLDDRTGTRSGANPHVGEFVWTQEANIFGWTSLLGEAPGGSDVSPYAAPARALDLSRLPPAYISVGSLDLFLEENIDYAARLLRSGVPVELHIFPGAYHGFELAADAPMAIRAEAERRLALANAFAVVPVVSV